MKSIKQAVVKIVDGKASVSILPEEPCGGGCHGCGACGGKPAESVYELPLADLRGHKAGDMVRVEIDGPGEITGGLVMFALPLVLLLSGGAVGNVLWDDTGMVVSGVCALALGFMLVWLLGRTVLRSSVRILDGAGMAS